MATSCALKGLRRWAITCMKRFFPTCYGSPCTARKTRIFAAQLGLKSCFTPAASPESNGVSEAFVKTIKRDYVHVSALPNPQEGLKQIVVWFEDYNENHTHSARGTRSPRGCVRASKKPA